MPAEHKSRSGAGKIIGIAVMLAAIVTVILLGFSWPAHSAKPHDLPIAVAGPAQQAEQVEAGISKSAPGSFDVSTVSNRADAVRQIKHGQAYGAVVLGKKPETLTSSAAGPAAAQLVTGVGEKIAAQQAKHQATQQGTAPAAQQAKPSMKTTDVVPLRSEDPNGAILGIASFPMVIGGIIGGILVSVTISGRLRRALAMAAYAVIAGAALTGILQGWYGALQNSYFANAGAIALSLFAIGSFVVGMRSVDGRVGYAIGPALFVLIGNPLSGTNSPWQFVPPPWGQIGQWMPQGAGGALLRDLSYFPDAAMAEHWLALAGWGVLGLILLFVGGLVGHSHHSEHRAVGSAGHDIPAPEARQSQRQ